MKIVWKSIVAAAFALPLAPALAAPSCGIPARLTVPHEERASARDPRRVLPIGRYTLALIWLPQNCRNGRSPGAGALDCGARAGKGGFVLHGLWPDGVGKQWPQWCAPAAPLPARTLRAQYCATPSTQLIQHEWSKHGTCMPGYDADRYLAESRRLFGGLRMPILDAVRQGRTNVGEVQRAFAGANRGMTPDMVHLNLDRQGWLEEVWICLDRRMRWASCPAQPGGAKATDPVRIWRRRA